MISKTGKQALNAMLLIAALPEHENAGAKDIAEKIGAPPNYLAKLLQLLSRHGLLVSQKGVNGGFRLAKHPSRISILDIIQPIDHIDKKTRCILGQNQCTDETACVLHSKWTKVRDSYISFLTQTTIADLIKRKRKKR